MPRVSLRPARNANVQGHSRWYPTGNSFPELLESGLHLVIAVVVIVVVVNIIIIIIIIIKWHPDSTIVEGLDARYSRANLTCLSLSLSLNSRSTARLLLPRRLVRAQEVSQKGLQHAEEKGDRQTERETRKGKGQRRKRERQPETEREKRRRRRRKRRRRRGADRDTTTVCAKTAGGGRGFLARRTGVLATVAWFDDEDEEGVERAEGRLALSERGERGGEQTAVAKDEPERRSGCGEIHSLSALPFSPADRHGASNSRRATTANSLNSRRRRGKSPNPR